MADDVERITLHPRNLASKLETIVYTFDAETTVNAGVQCLTKGTNDDTDDEGKEIKFGEIEAKTFIANAPDVKSDH
eukprot:CAMPEP_0175063146 /NCGR_PEP_ID=MMETSP0052_2-20121109/14583_1 /TAXON_ID=51329 ORGANISM="Polytomella parva, Strain SAG 63-3" /NCGR_SAMPLE_ID=MMETSP0052_2 /ASSEMBLY_ACC=CAM_ASM_000194 /LENGTH=75 /DNA_ID=CAMNT_0016329289 /DNA_START=541 /DNA_END=768 /DNA_ORIENTATION=-